MGYTCYAYHILIEPSSKFSLQRLATRLRKQYAKDKRQVMIDDSLAQLSLQIDNYRFIIALSQSVKQETEELAQHYLRHKRKRQKIMACTQQIEFWGDVDPTMAYFNDSLALLQLISKFKGTHVFDPQAGTFLEEM